MSTPDLYFRAGGGRLRFRDEGEGPALVFVHGWTLDLEAWDPQAAALAGVHRVVRYDRRGFGLSYGEPGRAADGEDLGRLLDHLGLPAVTLIGHSQGARVALAFALRHPDRVSSLVLDGPPDAENFSIGKFRALAREQGVAAFRQAWRAHPLMRLHGKDPAAAALIDRILERYPARELLGQATDPSPPRGANAISEFAKPVLVVNGALDARTRLRAGAALARSFPLAERVVLSGAGHLPNLDDAKAYNAAIRAFMRRKARAAA